MSGLFLVVCRGRVGNRPRRLRFRVVAARRGKAEADAALAFYRRFGAKPSAVASRSLTRTVLDALFAAAAPPRRRVGQ